MIGVLGISHKTASQDIRARFAFTNEEIGDFWEAIQHNTEITEAVVMSTCNRMEIYFYHNKPCCKKTFKVLENILKAYKRFHDAPEEIFYHYTLEDAVKHLFAVNSGVDSMVIGEDQIVSQVKEAYLHCTNLGMTDAVLMRMFQKSFETGKCVRSKTAIQQGATSVSYVGVDLCIKQLGDISAKKVLMIGAGETAMLSIKNLKKKGCNDITIANRTYEKAQRMAQHYSCKAIEYSEAKREIENVDIVFTATSAKCCLIGKKDISKSKTGKKVLIDLSLPRNINPNIRELDDVELVGMDELQNIVDGTATMREQSINEALQIIDYKSDEYFEWLDSRALRPIIKTITANMQKLREIEMPERVNQLDPKTYGIIDEYTGIITQKYIRNIIKNLKEITKNGNSTSSLKSIDELFHFDV